MGAGIRLETVFSNSISNEHKPQAGYRIFFAEERHRDLSHRLADEEVRLKPKPP
jgi:hypothetical protein